MTRLIDAEELLVRLSQYSRDDGYINLHMGTITTIVDNTPTVAEKPHGEWIEERDKRGHLISRKCPLCKAYHDGMLISFCPNCGADMRKEGEAE